MLSKRETFLRSRKLVSEEESDHVIAGLQEYQRDITVKLNDDLKKPIAAMKTLIQEYVDSLAETQNVIDLWTQNIHPNYQTPQATYADGTHRAPTPRPVMPYPISQNLRQLAELLGKLSKDGK